MVTAMIMTALDSVLALFVRERFGWNQSAQGLVFLALFIPQLVNPAVGMIRDRYAKAGRCMVSEAFAINCAALTLLRLVVKDSVGSKVLLCTLLAVIGLCITFSMTPLFVEISDVVRDRETGSGETEPGSRDGVGLWAHEPVLVCGGSCWAMLGWIH